MEKTSTPPRPNIGKLPDLSSVRRGLIILSLLIGLLMSVMNITIVSTSIFTISLQFNSLADSVWVILAYALTELGFAVIFMRFSDFWGRRNTVLIAFKIFTTFSIGCGFARTPAQLIALRTVQGIGGAGLYAVAILVTFEIASFKMLRYVSVYIGVTIAIGGILGPVLGGILTRYASWRWIFFINGPIGLITFITVLLCWPKDDKSWDHRSIKEFDVVGAFLFIAAALLLVLGLQEAGSGAVLWNSVIPVSTITFSCLCWISFFGWEFYLTQEQWNIAPMLPRNVWNNRPYVVGVFLTLLTGLIGYLAAFSIPLRFQIVNSESAAQAGVRLLPLLTSLALGSAIGAFSSIVRNVTFYTFLAGSAITAIACGLLSTLPDDLSTPTQIHGYEFLLGLGSGLTLASISLLTSMDTPIEEHAIAQAFIAQARVFGGTIGVVMSNALFNTRVHRDLSEVLTPAQIIQLQHSTGVLLRNLNVLQLEAVRVTYANSFNDSFRICTYIAVAGLALSLSTWQTNQMGVLQRIRAARAAKAAAAQAAAAQAEQQIFADAEAPIVPTGPTCRLPGCALCNGVIVVGKLGRR